MLTALPWRHDSKNSRRTQNLAKRAALNRATRPSPYELPNFEQIDSSSLASTVGWEIGKNVQYSIYDCCTIWMKFNLLFFDPTARRSVSVPSVTSTVTVPPTHGMSCVGAPHTARLPSTMMP